MGFDEIRRNSKIFRRVTTDLIKHDAGDLDPRWEGQPDPVEIRKGN